MAYRIEFFVDAENHLKSLDAHDRVIVLDAIDEQLACDPAIPTRRRKLLRPNPLADWQLRIGDFRAFYNVSDDCVSIVAIGIKQHNRLYIAGREFKL